MGDGETRRAAGTVYFWPDGILYVGTDMINEAHRHFTASVIFSRLGAFRIVADGVESETQGVMVAPNVDQELDARERMVILQVDPESDDYGRIAHCFDEKQRVRLLSDDQVASLRASADEALDGPSPDPVALWDSTIDTLSAGHSGERRRDDRIRRVLDILKADFLEMPPAAEIAKQVGLSEGRLIHLFTEQMGLPMRRYALWLRLREALFTIAEGSSLTEAAHQAGFSDSAHLSRTFRGMFGLPPSILLESRGAVRIAAMPHAGRGPSAHAADAERWERIARLFR